MAVSLAEKFGGGEVSTGLEQWELLKRLVAASCDRHGLDLRLFG
jgi:hypothetical protein